MEARRRHCRQASHKGYLAHDCPDFDGLRICYECEEFLHCGCFRTPRGKRAIRVAAERLGLTQSEGRQLPARGNAPGNSLP